MKKLFSLATGLMLAVAASAQVTEIGSFPPSDTLGLKNRVEIPGLPKKVDWGVQLGTSATFAGKYGSSFSTFVSPHMTWQPSKRFRVNAGISLINTTMFGVQPVYGYGFESGSSLDGNFTHALLYAEGQYLVGKNLQLSGSLYADVPLTGSDPKNPYSTRNFNGASFDIQYRIGSNATIQAGFHYIRMEGPYFYDPYGIYNTGYLDPFGTHYSGPFNP